MNVGEDLFEVGLPTLLGSATDTHSLQKITTCFFNNKQKQENYIKIMKDLLLNVYNFFFFCSNLLIITFFFKNL